MEHVQPTQERASFTTRVTNGLAAFRQGLRDGLPFPLWCQGALEALQAWILSLIVVFVPALAAWYGKAFNDATWLDSLKLGGQWWLTAHGVPLVRNADAVDAGGVLWFVPLGLTLIPFLLCVRAGRRLARASWSNQLWQPIAGAAVIYALGGLAAGFFGRTPETTAPWWAALLIPLVLAVAGMIVGARREAGSFSRLIGFDAAERVRQASQFYRWAGSYVWAVVRAGLVGALSAFGLAALLLVVWGFMHWTDLVDGGLQLSPGAIGSAVVMLGQMAYLPNFVVWALAYCTGGGLTLGAPSFLSPFESSVGPMPSYPILELLPSGGPHWWVLALPVIAGISAGWWFLREGENHLEEWAEIRTSPRWLALTWSTLVLGIVVSLVSTVLVWSAFVLCSGSLGVGVFTHFGPSLLNSTLFFGAELAVGTMLGYLVAPLFERDPVLDA
ncbi:MAG: cell division protein PerM [Galactobacter sp.]